MATVLGLTADDWTAAAAVGTLLVALAASLVALGQLGESRRLRAEQAQPYVVVYLAASAASSVFYDLVVKNFGLTVARDVQIRISPHPLGAALGDESEGLHVPDFPVLVPGQEWRTFWDSTLARHDSGLPDLYRVAVSFAGAQRKDRFELTFEIDWAVVRRGYIEEYGIHDAAKALREMQKTLSAWKEGAGKGMAVFVRDGDARDKRTAKFLKRRRKAAEKPPPGKRKELDR